MLPDGAGVVLASKLLRTPVKQKVAGVDFAAGLLGILERNGQSLYLLGGKTGIGELAAQKMLEAHPQLRIAGIADGYFQDEAPVIAKINASGADALFVRQATPRPVGTVTRKSYAYFLLCGNFNVAHGTPPVKRESAPCREKIKKAPRGRGALPGRGYLSLRFCCWFCCWFWC